MNGEEIQNKVNFYADAFDKAQARVNNVELAAVIVQQIGKDLRTAQIQGATGNSANDNGSPASPKQLGYLKSLGVTDIPEGITKKQASELIDDAVGE